MNENIFNLNKPDAVLSEINLSDTSKRIGRHNRLQLLGLGCLLAIVTLAGLVYLNPQNETENEEAVLGMVNSLQKNDEQVNVKQVCIDQGGVITTSNEDEQKQSWCYFSAEKKCLLDESLVVGECVVEVGAVLGVTQSLPETPSITPTPTTSNITDTLSVYSAQITKKPDGIDPVEPTLKDYLETALRFNEPGLGGQTIVKVLYDTRVGSPFEEDKKYYFDYIVLVEGEKLVTPNNYEDYATIIRLEEMDEELVPLLINNNYCERDDECRVRRSYCDYGAYNNYEKYVDAYQCMQIMDEFGEGIVHYDNAQSCKAERVYAEPRCIENNCVPTKEAARCMP